MKLGVNEFEVGIREKREVELKVMNKMRRVCVCLCTMSALGQV